MQIGCRKKGKICSLLIELETDKKIILEISIIDCLKSENQYNIRQS